MPLAFGEFSYDPLLRELRRRGALLKVDPQILDLLGCFLDSPCVLLSHEQLIAQAWKGRAPTGSALNVTIGRLRKVLGHVAGKNEVIDNRYGRGYRMRLPVTVISEKPGTTAADRPPSRASAPLVGRSDQLLVLDAALSRARRGEGSLCALLGEPGIGKTRLAEAVEGLALQHGVASAWGRFFAAESAPPLWSIAQVLRALNRDGLADGALRLLADDNTKRESVDAPESLSLARAFNDNIANSIHRTIDATVQALLQLSRQEPLLIVLDDLQWADSASLRLLNYLALEISRWPLLLVITARSGGPGSRMTLSRELSRLVSQYKCERIELARLRPADVTEYIAATFTGDITELDQSVFKRSAGNPFFMVEMLRPSVGQPVPDAAQLLIEGPALEIVRKRLAALPETTRDVLAAAAVIGHDFELGLLSGVTQKSGFEILEALDSSLANDTIVAGADATGDFAFDHELIREALYNELPDNERRALHLRVGEALLRRARTDGSGAPVLSSELAQHFLSALPLGNVDAAIAHARAAALAATLLGSHANARALLRRAFEASSSWQKPDPETLAALLLELAMVERIMADAAYVDHLKQGLAIAREHRFGALLTAAGRMLSPSPGLLARAEAGSVLEAAVEVLPQSDLARRAIALAHLSWTPPNGLSSRRVGALLAEASALAVRSNDLEALASVRDARMFFSAGPETQRSAEKLAIEIDQELEKHPETAISSRVIGTVTLRYVFATQRGDKPAVERASAERVSALQRLNNSELNWHHERILLIERMNRGDLAGVDVALENLRQRAERLRLQSWPALWVLDQSQLLLWTGEGSLLVERMRPGLALTAGESPTTLSRKLRLLLSFGFLDDARTSMATLSSDALRDLPHDRDYLEVMFQLAMVAAAVGSEEQRRTLYELLSPHANFYAAGISFHNDGSMSHCLGMLARSLDDDAAALGHYEHACERNRQFELPPRTLTSQFELAKLLQLSAAAESRTRGSRLLAETLRGARSLGLVALARAIELHRS